MWYHQKRLKSNQKTGKDGKGEMKCQTLSWANVLLEPAFHRVFTTPPSRLDDGVVLFGGCLAAMQQGDPLSCLL
jgi:hypothetical protein